MKKKVPREPPCWHCLGTDRCDCMFCLVATPKGFEPGPCGFCAGRREQDALRPILEKNNIDPRDRRHWKRVGNPRDQAPPHPVVIPLEEFRKRKEKP